MESQKLRAKIAAARQFEGAKRSIGGEFAPRRLADG
jgi:hypothetical protein